MGIACTILLLNLVLHFSFANENHDLLKSEIQKHKSLSAVEASLFSFLQDIKNANYSLTEDFLTTSTSKNDFETRHQLEREKDGFLWIFETPSLQGSKCGIRSDLQLVEKKTKIHYATLYLNGSCSLSGFSYYQAPYIHHVDISSKTTEYEAPNPDVTMVDQPLYFYDEQAFTPTLESAQTVRACVIDNGFDLSHQGLQQRLAYENTFLSLDLTDNDNNTFTNSPHGTHVAGLVSKGNQNIKIVPVKITTSDNLRLGNLWRSEEDIKTNVLFEIEKALDFCAKHKTRIVNLSLVYESSDSDYEDYVDWREQYKNILQKYPDFLYVVAAGNRSHLLESTVVFPAGLRMDNLITVGAYDTYTNDIWYDAEGHGSNYSASSVDVLAPGVFIHSFSMDNSFDSFTGTSMASPIVANYAAKLLLASPDLTAKQLKEVVLSHAKPIPSLLTKVRGGRLLIP